DLLGALNKQNVFVSVRGDSLRVTPHLYNDESDIAQFLKALLPFTDQR
ncbi:MAG: aminotransferase, partial [Gammaproteobacteria bacterium]|nr:aminotransferase [Gammaproteobacteria bacterium]NDA14938.1 aminotransferase [Gammaproteobacteria bacterium]NDG44320.1 aminotransferase [Gammaproteobacteria bacterium]